MSQTDPRDAAVTLGLLPQPGQKLVLNDLLFERVEVPGGHGADDYEADEGEAFTLRAFPDPSAARAGDMIGYIDYNMTADAVRIRWVQVVPQARRRGLGALLITRLAQLHPGLALETGGMTDDGEALLSSLPFEIAEVRGGGE